MKKEKGRCDKQTACTEGVKLILGLERPKQFDNIEARNNPK